ncbi:hypothetical protein [uncultured Maribacter sp.]|uniref:hypothetical protein n=1 Tax=uncultured Maribacter sp. TaxID=431308 RepID=UPI002631111B|nr:hypothetical protein [uncultured Maribacter sp.]
MKEFYKKNKEFLPALIILPTLFGTIIQLLQLIIISPTFYKFFSISQAVIDGSFLLFQLIAILIVVNFYSYFANDDEFIFFESQIYRKGNSKQKAKKLFWRLLIINSAFLLGTFYFQKIISDFKFPSLKTSLFYLVLSILGGIFISKKRTKSYLKNLLELHRNRKKPKKNNHGSIQTWYIIAMSIFFLIPLIFNSSLPKADFNNSQIINKISIEHDLEDVQILFYSDTYLIINIQNKDCIWQKAVFKTDDYFIP